MNEQDRDKTPVDDTNSPKEPACACTPECACHTSGAPDKTRWVLGAIVLIAAAGLVARAMIKNRPASDGKPAAGFAALATPAQTATPGANVVAATNDAPATAPETPGREIGALAELNTVAAAMHGVFVFLPGKGETTAEAPAEQILAASKTIETRGARIGYFTLKTDSRDYEQVAAQVAVPGVLAMVKGGGMTVVTGNVTEAKLVQAFVAASTPSGCGTGGCGPSGCN